jgi:hypothetical protein
LSIAFCFLFLILYIANESKLSSAFNAIAPESGAKKPLHRFPAFAGRSVGFGTIIVLG